MKYQGVTLVQLWATRLLLCIAIVGGVGVSLASYQDEVKVFKQWSEIFSALNGSSEANKPVQKLSTDNLYWIPVASAIGFQMLHACFNYDLKATEDRNTTGAPFVHALITTFSSHSVFLKQSRPFWEYAIDSDFPQSYLEIIPPLISLGYSMYELSESVTHSSAEFFIHGAAMFLGLYYLNKAGKIHLANAPLLTEASTIFYNLRRVDSRFMYPFGILFIIYRWGVFPGIVLSFLKNVYWKDVRYEGKEHVMPIIGVGGSVLSMMNLWWGVKIIKKMAAYAAKKP